MTDAPQPTNRKLRRAAAATGEGNPLGGIVGAHTVRPDTPPPQRPYNQGEPDGQPVDAAPFHPAAPPLPFVGNGLDRSVQPSAATRSRVGEPPARTNTPPNPAAPPRRGGTARPPQNGQDRSLQEGPTPPPHGNAAPSRPAAPSPEPPSQPGTPVNDAPPHNAKPRRAKRKRGTGDAPPTPAEIIRLKRRRCADAADIAGFLTKLVAIVVLLAGLFGFAFGLTPMQNDDMAPRISAGDLLFYYRLADDLTTGSVLVFEKDGQQYVGRIVAHGGDTVEVTDQATLVVNGSTVLENDIYYTTPKYDNGPAYPLTLAADEFFVLCDYREGARDSRYFGPVSRDEIKGKVITVIRRSGL